MNALNMFDGINGQSGLYILFFCLILLLITKNSDILFLIISILIFLYFNLKNKFFIGNSGINFLGSILSYLVLKIYKIPTVILVEDILSLMFLPGIELCRLFFLRIASKKNPFIGDKNHIHHILNKKFKLSNVLLINNFLAFSPYVLLNYIKVKFLVVFILFLYFNLVFPHKKNIK
jgi:UDP-GlcNAc:undecaprenyl-phosphate GlcNAc-1-phosphate transferase